MTHKTLLHSFVMILAALFALVSFGRLLQLHSANDLLGLWDLDARGKLAFPPQATLSGDQLPYLVLQRNLHFRATDAPMKRPDLRAVLEDYGLEESHLDDVIHRNNLPPAPGVTDQLLEIPLNNP